MNKIVIVNNLKYKKILQDISFRIENGEFIVISGPNNCGKTTLMRILNRDLIVEEDIRINGLNLNSYKIEEFNKIVQLVVPKEFIPIENCLEEELLLINNNPTIVAHILKLLKLQTIARKKWQQLNLREKILSQIAIALIKGPEILLLDGIGYYLEEKETIKIMEALKKWQELTKITIIMTTLNLKESLYSDYLYIIENGTIVLQGKPVEVLEKDNIINKIGLNIPFMVDLSVKLKDYNLVDSIELIPEKMVENLWN